MDWIALDIIDGCMFYLTIPWVIPFRSNFTLYVAFYINVNLVDMFSARRPFRPLTFLNVNF